MLSGDRSSSPSFAPPSPVVTKTVHSYGVEVRDLTLYALVPARRMSQGLQPKLILSDVNVTVRPGRLVAIMGGSGSGKTTLLNLMANRIPHRCLRQPEPGKPFVAFTSDIACSGLLSNPDALYAGTGSVLFNNRVPSARDIRQLVGYGESLTYLSSSITDSLTLFPMQFNSSTSISRPSQCARR